MYNVYRHDKKELASVKQSNEDLKNAILKCTSITTDAY